MRLLEVFYYYLILDLKDNYLIFEKDILFKI